ncbi:MAG TPA: hypothetical protein PKD91_02115 [Bacteroidia bacterium]|nr:hypothetical protein [Bacteroidia bacterium]
MNFPDKPKEVPETPAIPEIRPDVNIPAPKTEPEHPVRIVPIEEPGISTPPEVDPEREKSQNLNRKMDTKLFSQNGTMPLDSDVVKGTEQGSE